MKLGTGLGYVVCLQASWLFMPAAQAQVAQAATQGKPFIRSVGVIPFDVIGRGVDPSAGEALAEVMQSALVRGGAVRVMERAQFKAIMTEQDLQVTDMVDPATAVRVGRIAGVDRLVVGSIATVENIYTVSCRVVDVETGEAAEAEEFMLDTFEKYPQLGRLLASLIGERPIAEDSIAAEPALSMLFEDDKTRLEVGISPKTNSGALLDKGRYVMIKGSPGNQYSWIPGVERDFYLQVDLAQIGGSPDDGAGVIWGAQETDAYLGIWIDGRRSVRIERRQGGTTATTITRLHDFPALLSPPRSNRVRVETWDDRHRVFVNGDLVEDFYEPGFAGGRTALRVFQRDPGEKVVWAADNLIVGQIKPQRAGIDVEGPDRRHKKADRARPTLTPRKKRIARSEKSAVILQRVWITPEFARTPKLVTVNARMQVINHRRDRLRAVVQFFDPETGEPMMSRSPQFAEFGGRVRVDRVFVPRHRVSTYGEMSLSIPLGQLPLRRGQRAIACRLMVQDISGNEPRPLAKSDVLRLVISE